MEKTSQTRVVPSNITVMKDLHISSFIVWISCSNRVGMSCRMCVDDVNDLPEYPSIRGRNPSITRRGTPVLRNVAKVSNRSWRVSKSIVSDLA